MPKRIFELEIDDPGEMEGVLEKMGNYELDDPAGVNADKLKLLLDLKPVHIRLLVTLED